MIAYIEGKLVEIDPTYIIIDTGGIGYHVNISLLTFGQIKNLTQARIFTHFHVKEDAQTLYGFFDQDEKKRFQQLISISGVGPSTGLMILSSLSSQELHSAIVNSDVKTISSVKGIGQKTAQRIILELKDKMSKEELESNVPILSLKKEQSIKSEALAALTTLGISKSVAEKTLDKILKSSEEDIGLEDLIKLALKRP
ncbi:MULTISPECIES: Holliday junction branch migration protein RuvA [Reichenbachiella]|uniref:Holliday junction branch migration complex subunit RuvA n=1 Tax=Reichenbachiella agariperforans TaxID=156994 RepID=A0A1M6TQE8_REIAG|nr:MULTISPECIES: Holliday junction branch migration protein RuvA [Reichenbachiella]MBU2915531.1 Holliday junction branch migration protein RuvA [Reichenbachiella agariperforans]RJE71404.1 Holliday junction DNA helicase RuvA [Reichenbachiella sp. MSK19-1]SHK59201.1 Holliday junction DNA helicase subunit RuvA [Reichenbachiella agariperforans]